MDVFALGVEVLRGHCFLELLNSHAFLRSFFFFGLFGILLSLGLSFLFQGKVQFKRQYLRIVFVEMLATADLRILKLVEHDESFARQRLV